MITNARTRGSRAADAGSRGYRRTDAMTRSGCRWTNFMTGSSYRRTNTMTGSGCRWTDAMESFMPTFPLAAMVLIIKILVIMLTDAMSPPIGISLFKIPPVMRIALIPRIPLRRIPVTGSDNIGGWISIIRRPAILIAEKLMQYSIQKPITLVKGPRRIIPDPRVRVRILGRGCIVIASITLTIRRG
jgi:hypothetical protein